MDPNQLNIFAEENLESHPDEPYAFKKVILGCRNQIANLVEQETNKIGPVSSQWIKAHIGLEIMFINKKTKKLSVRKTITGKIGNYKGKKYIVNKQSNGYILSEQQSKEMQPISQTEPYDNYNKKTTDDYSDRLRNH